MKIISKGGMLTKDNTGGIINIEDWIGYTMTIDKESLKDAIGIFDDLAESGLNTNNIHIGISKDGLKTGIFCMFLDVNKTVAYAIAGKREEE